MRVGTPPLSFMMRIATRDEVVKVGSYFYRRITLECGHVTHMEAGTNPERFFCDWCCRYWIEEGGKDHVRIPLAGR